MSSSNPSLLGCGNYIEASIHSTLHKIARLGYDISDVEGKTLMW